MGERIRHLLSSWQSHEVWTVPVSSLTPLHRYAVAGMDPAVLAAREALFSSLDSEGMRHPLIAYSLTPDEWARRLAERREPPGAYPRIMAGAVILAVKVGNQRMEYAESRRYTHVSCVLLHRESDCFPWKENHLGG